MNIHTYMCVFIAAVIMTVHNHSKTVATQLFIINGMDTF